MFDSYFMSSPEVAAVHLMQNESIHLMPWTANQLGEKIMDQVVDEATAHFDYVRNQEWQAEMEIEREAELAEERRLEWDRGMKELLFPTDHAAWCECDECEPCTEEPEGSFCSCNHCSVEMSAEATAKFLTYCDENGELKPEHQAYFETLDPSDYPSIGA
jgi:hypothetical protein